MYRVKLRCLNSLPCKCLTLNGILATFHTPCYYLQSEFPQWGPVVIVENMTQRWWQSGGRFIINSKPGIKNFSLENCHGLGGFIVIKWWYWWKCFWRRKNWVIPLKAAGTWRFRKVVPQLRRKLRIFVGMHVAQAGSLWPPLSKGHKYVP